MGNIEIDYPFPPLDKQDRYVKSYEKISAIKEQLNDVINEIDKLL